MAFTSMQLKDLQSLVSDGFVDLFEILLPEGGQMYLRDGEKCKWGGKTYESIAIQISGVEDSSDGSDNTPVLKIQNPGQIFSALVASRAFEKATVIRRRVLSFHLTANYQYAQVRSWYVSQCTALSPKIVTFGLRQLAHGPNFKVPARTFTRDKFPSIRVR